MMDTHELAKYMLDHPPGKIQCSVDISTGEKDADSRVFGDFTEVNYPPSEGKFFNSDHIMLLFEGSLNTTSEAGS